MNHRTSTTEQAWTAFSTRLRGYIRRQLRNDDAVEDILQEVFLRMHAHGATVRAEEKLSAWLYQVTRNAIMDYHRRRRSERAAPLPPDAAERFAMPKADTTHQRIQALFPCVRAMVEALPEPYREALLLTEYESLTQKALAERLGLSFSGAKTRVQRARDKLRSLLLACCHLEFDHAGRVVDYHPSCACCREDACSANVPCGGGGRAAPYAPHAPHAGASGNELGSTTCRCAGTAVEAGGTARE